MEFLIPLIGIFVALTAIVVLLIVSVRRHWWSWCCPGSSHRRENIDPTTLRMDTMTVDALPAFKFRLGQQSNSPGGETCLICHENYTEDELIAILPCKHEFHTSCVTSVLTDGGTILCPVCSHDMRRIP